MTRPSRFALLRRLLALVALMLLLLGANPARAVIACTATATPLNFGDVNPLSSQVDATAQIDWKCVNPGPGIYSARVCFHIDEAPPGTTSNRLMKDPSLNRLRFLLYRNAARSQQWGSTFAGTTPQAVTLRGLPGGGAQTGALTIYGRVRNGQGTTAIPGNYTDEYLTGETKVTVNEAPGTSVPGACNLALAGDFPFVARARVIKQCLVAPATPDADLGTHPSTATNINGDTTFRVTCSRTTPYFIGLRPSNNALNGAGVMKAPLPNTDQVPYQLYRNAARTNIWGDTATDVSPGNGVGGTGSGAAKNHRAYVRAPSANFQPDTYADTVTISVHY